MTRHDTQRRYTVMAWRRKIAVSESRALRAYLRTAGHYPTHAPTNWKIA